MADQETIEEVVQDASAEDNVTKVNTSHFSPEEEVYKVDLSNPIQNETEDTPEQEEESSDIRDDGSPPAEGEVQPEEEVQEHAGGVLTDVTNEEVEPEEVVDTATTEAASDIPEGVSKLLEFMEDTGGDINDYVRLNRDIDSLDTSDVVNEYFKETKPHLDAEERAFLLEETFGFDEEVDDERDIRKKKIALKEQAAAAREYLENNKTKYYEEIKAGEKLTPDQRNAVDFFNRYNKETKEQEKLTKASTDAFKQGTDNVFNDNFKGFDYQVGDKKFRFNVKNAEETKVAQSDLNNFVNKFVGEDNTIQDAAGYHKGLFTAMNSDAIAQHFYEQGKADGVKESNAKVKNVNSSGRQTHGETHTGGVKYKVLSESASGFKVKKRK